MLNYLKRLIPRKPPHFKKEKFLDKTFLTKGITLNKADYDDAWLFALGLRSKFIMDVGPNQGQSTLKLLYGDQVEKIWLIEPNPQALSLAAEHLIYNQLAHKAHFISKLASNEDGSTIDFHTVGAGAAGSIYPGHAKSANKAGQYIEVETTTIDRILTKSTQVPDLVKIDVEGAEKDVLNGATGLAAELHTAFMVEMHATPEQGMKENADQVLNWCSSVGYQAWYLKEKTALNQAQPIEHRGRCHLLLLPADHSFPAYLTSINQGDAVS